MEEQRVTVVTGGQAGSEGKGAVTGRLHLDRKYDIAVRVGGPNAGHSVVHPESGTKFALRQIPVAAVVDPHCQLAIAPGSEVDPWVLADEIQVLAQAGIRVYNRLWVDPTATFLVPEYANQEAGLQHGTTGKGIGAARAARALRQAKLIGEYRPTGDHFEWILGDVGGMLRETLSEGGSVMIEGTQGYELGSHAGSYPYCTSGDCKASDFIAAAGLPPVQADVWNVLRTYPIRIAGNSGPLPGETDWEAIGVPPEYTTVTKKMRRVAQWNWDWAMRSVRANQDPLHPERCKLALTFADYWWPELRMSDGDVWFGDLDQPIQAKLNEIAGILGAEVGMVGTGPAHQLRINGQKERY